MPLMTIYGADADRAGRSPGSGASIEAAFGVPDCIIRYPHPAHKFPLDLHAKLMSHQRGLVRWRQVGVAARGGIIGATMACLSPGGRGLLRLPAVAVAIADVPSTWVGGLARMPVDPAFVTGLNSSFQCATWKLGKLQCSVQTLS